jgi:spore coat polysaccharide biosynthesis protein SpsF (cytidylyltransferase family)
VTSNDASDNILEEHVIGQHGIAVFRGALENVFLRYQDCLRHFPCEWFVRICADSPFIDPDLIALMLRAVGDGDHLVSNVVERSFPPGQSVEVIRTEVFQALSSDLLDSYEREHVTGHFYRHPDRYRIRSVTTGGASFGGRRLVVDTPDDLRAAELMIRESPDLLRGYAAQAVVAA